MQDIKGKRGGDDKGKKEGGGNPVDVGFGCLEILGGAGRNGSKCDPVPRDNNIEEDQLGEAKEAALVYFVWDVGRGGYKG